MTVVHRSFPVATHILLRRGDQILLSKRRQTGYFDGSFGLVSGHLEGRETVFEASCRESREEIGIELDADSLRMAGVMHRLADSERVEFFVEASAWTGVVRNLELSKCQEVSWFPFMTLPDNIVPYIRLACNLLTAYPTRMWFAEPDVDVDE